MGCPKQCESIHLLVADDSQMGCQLLRDTFSRSRTPIKVVDCATSQDALLRAAESHSCHVALINENLGDGPLTGFQALRELRRVSPKTRPIILLKSNHDDLVVDAFRVGAKGVYCRNEPLKTLTKCIMAVHSGQVWANSAQLNSVFDAFADAAPLRTSDPKRANPLTKRENEVVKLAVEGLSNREVAEQLRLTEHTVSNYLFRIYEKLGISSRVELVLYALRRQAE